MRYLDGSYVNLANKSSWYYTDLVVVLTNIVT